MGIGITAIDQFNKHPVTAGNGKSPSPMGRVMEKRKGPHDTRPTRQSGGYSLSGAGLNAGLDRLAER